MPPKLNIKPVTLSPEFIDLMAELYGQWMKRNERMIARGAREPNGTAAHFAMTAKRMLPIVRKISPEPRVGLDYEVTRLKVLKFTDFLVVRGPHPNNRVRKNIRWMVGRTKHVTATEWNNRSHVMGELGSYDIYLPETIVIEPDLSHIHMIPHRHQYSINRHFHHYLQVSERPTSNPLNLPTGNCWGDYTGPIKSLMDEPDFPELFRQLYNHLSTYGYAPPRRDLDFDTRTPEGR